MSNPLPTADRLRTLLRYDGDTGQLFWLPRDTKEFRQEKYAIIWNGLYAGTEAGTVHKRDGYRYIKIAGRRLVAHRIIWAMVTDEWPALALDHINHIRLNNRMENLREVGYAGNALNRAMKSDNTSGHTGVDPRPNGKFHARIQIRGVKTYLGTFDSLEKAARVRAAAEERMGFSNTHGQALDV